MPTSCQTTDVNIQFNGTAGRGLFEFGQYANSPHQRRLHLNSIAYFETGIFPILTNIRFFFVNPTNAQQVIAIGAAVDTELIDQTGQGWVRFSNILIPRQGGVYWPITVDSNNKINAGTVCVDFSFRSDIEDI